MRMLRDKYSVIRNELGRIPMLTDIYRHDPSLVMTMAQKANSYYDFARDTEAMLSRKGHDEGFADALVPIDTQGEQWLKMATEVLLVAIRPQELDSPRRTTPLHSSNRRSACSTGRSSTHPPRNRMGNARSSNASETGFALRRSSSRCSRTTPRSTASSWTMCALA